jgi:DNA polymerase-3 subunit delta
VKVEGARITAFLRNPGAVRGVLLYGEDEGLRRERAEALVIAVAGARDDPFRVSVVPREAAAADPGRLAGEMAALSMMGGRRAVWVRDATNVLAAAVEAALGVPGDSVLVVEAGSLRATDRLRVLFERRADAAAIGCWPETGAELRASIAATLKELEVAAEPDAIVWLADHLGADRGITKRELEKLALSVGPGGRVDVASCEAVVGDHATLDLDAALFAALAGDLARADRALRRAVADGANPVTIVRTALRHLQRLDLALAEELDRLSPKEAARRARPAVFFRHEQDFARALAVWTRPRVGALADRLLAAEAACKTTGAPDALVAARAVHEIACWASAARRG